MADWNRNDQGRGGSREQGPGQERDWRGGRDWDDDRGLLESRYGGDPARREARAFGGREEHARDPGERDMRQARDERAARSGGGESSGSGRSGPDVGRGFGERGDSAFGRMTSGSSDSGLGGYGGTGAGGWGQPNLNSQSGQGGYAPLNQGLDYGQDGGGSNPAGFDPGGYGSSTRPGSRDEPAHDPHHASYHHWRNTQLSSHDRDYARWREEQTRRYDEDYGSWRNERHSAFSKEFEGWRAGRGGQAGVPASAQPATSSGSVSSSPVVNPSEGSVYSQSNATSAASGVVGYAHGANPTLARIADGDTGHPPHHEEGPDRVETDK